MGNGTHGDLLQLWLVSVRAPPKCLCFLQEVNDCYLELFQSYLYFQSMGFNGLTYQVGRHSQTGGTGRAGQDGTGEGNPAPGAVLATTEQAFHLVNSKPRLFCQKITAEQSLTALSLHGSERLQLSAAVLGMFGKFVPFRNDLLSSRSLEVNAT